MTSATSAGIGWRAVVTANVLPLERMQVQSSCAAHMPKTDSPEPLLKDHWTPVPHWLAGHACVQRYKTPMSSATAAPCYSSFSIACRMRTALKICKVLQNVQQVNTWQLC